MTLTHLRVTNAWILLMSLVVIAAIASGAFAQTSSEKVHDDADYCFRLTTPSDEWTLHDEVTSRRLSTTSVASASSKSGTWGFVAVRPMRMRTLAAHAEPILNDIRSSGRTLRGPVEIEFLSSKALRYQVTATAEDAETWLDVVLVAREGFVYSLVSSDTTARTSRTMDQLAPFHTAFSFLPGKPKVRAPAWALGDRIGVDHEVRQGVFRSALLGIAIEPKPKWSLISGPALETFNSSAHVGLFLAEREAHVLLLAERADPSDSAALMNMIRGEPDADLSKRIPPMRVRILGENWDLTPMEAEQSGVEQLRGVSYLDGFVVQVLVTYHEADRAAVRGLLPDGLASVRRQTADERKESIARIVGAPDPCNVVLPKLSVRNGIVRDFANAYRWRKPAGMWRIRTGDDARSMVDGCALYVEELDAGIFGYVMCEEGDGADLETYATNLAQAIFENGDVGETKERKFGEARGFVTVGRIDGDPDSMLHVAVAQSGKRRYRFAVGGLRKSVERADAAVQAALDGFHVLAKSEPTAVTTKQGVRDERVGFEFSRPDDGWRRKSIRSRDFDAGGSVVVYVGKTDDTRSIGVFAECYGGSPASDEFRTKFATEWVRAQYANDDRAFAGLDRPFVETSDEILGLPCRRLSWSDDQARVDVLLFMRQATGYMLIAVGPKDSGVLQTARTSFALLP